MLTLLRDGGGERESERASRMGGGAGACRVGGRSTCWKENSVTLDFPECRFIPLGLHSFERASGSPTPSEGAPQRPSERPGYPTPPDAPSLACQAKGMAAGSPAQERAGGAGRPAGGD